MPNMKALFYSKKDIGYATVFETRSNDTFKVMSSNLIKQEWGCSNRTNTPVPTFTIMQQLIFFFQSRSKLEFKVTG